MLSAEEARVLGSMVEKAMTTPDHYPMSLNAVVTACNQVSNRDPVVTFAEPQVELTLRSLADRGLAKMVHRPGDRVVKYRHALDAALEVGDQELALISVLLLRSAQTPGELRQRSQRYVDFASLAEVEVTLEDLRHREEPLVTRLDRRPGQKEYRYRHLLTPDGESMSDDEWPASIDGEEPVVAPHPASNDDEVASLRAEVSRLAERVDRMARELGIE
jgi:uncharacterized protein YceH (UPF0502 family)